MPDIPGLDADIFFGDPDDQPDEMDFPTTEEEDQDEDTEMSPEEKKWLEGILGFSPDELDEPTE